MDNLKVLNAEGKTIVTISCKQRYSKHHLYRLNEMIREQKIFCHFSDFSESSTLHYRGRVSYYSAAASHQTTHNQVHGKS